MSLNAGLSTIHEDDIAKHLATAQSMVTRLVIIETDNTSKGAAIAGTGRRFVSTVSSAGQRHTKEVELAKTIQKVHAGDQLMTPQQHNVLYCARRAVMIGLAVGELFSRQTNLEQLLSKNASAPLSGDDANSFKALLAAASYVAAFTFAAYLSSKLTSVSEAVEDISEPDFLFDTPQDGLKSMVAGLDRALSGAPDDSALVSRARAFAWVALEGLIGRKARFSGLAAFESVHIHIEQDDFDLNGFDIAPGQKSKPLVMSFKRPDEVIGNHIAKYQAMKLAKMMMAYDFERRLNPFVELGGFLFTFIGDGMPGTGKTTLIQMIAGLLNDYCQVAGYAFHYENFGVDQISSYQGKSGQNCKEFINNVINPKAIGFGTIDDIDQVAARRSDDRASAGQQEVTAVLMESFGGASTVIRGNCSFGMFSNHPENVDDALRQRAGSRWLVDGPQSREDYIDIFALLVGKNHSIPLGEHQLYAGQEIKRAVSQSYANFSTPAEEGLVKVWEHFVSEGGQIKTLADIGAYLHLIKQAEPRFTGRAVKNIADAIKMRAMDVELPDEWFEKPEAFMHKSYDDKKTMIEALRGPITIEMIIQEINRYGDSEFRYTDKADDAAISDIIRRERQREKAIGQMEAMKKDGRWQK